MISIPFSLQSLLTASLAVRGRCLFFKSKSWIICFPLTTTTISFPFWDNAFCTPPSRPIVSVHVESFRIWNEVEEPRLLLTFCGRERTRRWSSCCRTPRRTCCHRGGCGRPRCPSNGRTSSATALERAGPPCKEKHQLTWEENQNLRNNYTAPTADYTRKHLRGMGQMFPCVVFLWGRLTNTLPLNTK